MLRQFFSFVLFACFSLNGLAQQADTPGDFPTSDFHKERRDEVRDKLPSNSVAVFFSNAVRNRSNDVNYIYHQDPNFFYLTGYREPHSLLMIFKDQQTNGAEEKYDEIIYVRPRNAAMETWNGKRLGTKGVEEQLGFVQVFTNNKFKDLSIDFSTFDKVIFYDFQNDVRDTREEGDLYDLISQFKLKVGYPDPKDQSLTMEPQPQNLDTKSLDQIMRDLRTVKLPVELELIRKAVKISVVGQNEVMKAMRPGMSEREVQGIHEFVFKKYGSEFEGYPSIVGSSHNGCILHYEENDRIEVKNEDLILMDLGAEYHGYTADVTRTIPVSGKFSEEQKAIYNIVYQAQENAIQACKPGVSFQELSLIARKEVAEGLMELGIIQREEESRRYYPHGLSHHIGLDVHDLGNYGLLEPNMVITIEPGIYIPEGSDCDEKWWNLAVRIEDDILITEDGFENLSEGSPRKWDEIEEMMTKESPLDDFILPELGNR